MIIAWLLLNVCAHVFVFSPPGYWAGAWWTVAWH